MKNKSTIKSLLGLTQEEMSMLLGITRSQWAMYETDKRDLSVSAKKQLQALLTHKQNTKEPSSESLKQTNAEQRLAQEWLQGELQQVEFKKRELDKKITTLQNKRAEGFAALEMAHFLETQHFDDYREGLSKIIRGRAIHILNKHALPQLLDLQLKKEQIELVKNSMEQKIKEISNELQINSSMVSNNEPKD